MILTVVLILTLFPVTASASGTSGDVRWDFNAATGVFTVSGIGAMKDYYDWSSALAPWDSYKGSIKSVVIEDGVTYIGQDAFEDCVGLTSVTIGESVTSIGGSAFYGCTQLTAVRLPDSVVSIGSGAFSMCNNLSSINIPEGVTIIQSSVFSHCDSLTSVVIPNGVTTIGESAFYHCDSLTTITIADSVTLVDSNAFWCCDNLAVVNYAGTMEQWKKITMGIRNTDLLLAYAPLLLGVCGALNWELDVQTGVLNIFGTGPMGEYYREPWHDYRNLVKSVVIEDGVTSISESAFDGFDGFENLTSVTLGDSVTTIGKRAFYHCIGLTSLTLGDGVTTIGESAFYGCTGLTSVRIPDSVKTIGNSAFYKCAGLTTVTLGDGAMTIGEYAFSGCAGLTSVTLGDGVTAIGDSAFSGCTGLTSVTLGDGVTAIGKRAFSGCTQLTSVRIPDSVKTIGDSAFYNCNSLAEVSYTGTREQWGAISMGEGNGILQQAYAGTLSGVCGEALVWELKDDGVLTITGTGAMTAYSDRSPAPWHGANDVITAVMIGDGVTSIGSYAFADCARVETVTIGKSVTTIGESAFYGCTQLTSVVIPDGVTTIGDFAFAYCAALTSVVIPDSVTTLGRYAFDCCSSLTSVVIPDSVTTIGEFAFDYCGSLTSVEIPGSVTTLGRYAFANCGALSSVTIGNGVTSLEDGAFSMCTSLETVRWPASLTYVGTCAFYEVIDWGLELAWEPMLEYFDCPLADIYYDGTTEQWDAIVFEDEYDKGLVTGAELHFVYENGICGAEGDNLAWILDGNGTLTIFGSGAMAAFTDGGAPWAERGKDIRSIEIAEGVTTIGNWAFRGCTALERVTLPDSLEKIGDHAFRTCTALLEVKLPAGVECVGESAFGSCDSLKAIEVAQTNKVFCDIDGVLFTKDQKTLLAYPGGHGAVYEIPETVTKIGDHAFMYCSKLTAVTIPDGVTVLDDYAFCGCSGLVSVTIPEHVSTLAEGVFYRCTALADVVIPKTVTNIKTSAFYYCNALCEVYFMGSKDQGTDITVGDKNTPLTAAQWHYMQPVYTDNGDLSHTAVETCSECAVTLGLPVVSACVDADADQVCDLCGVAMKCRHNCEAVLNITPNSDGRTHCVTMNCASCGVVVEELLVDAECSFEDGVCTECGREQKTFEIDGSNMTLGNRLEVNFLIAKKKLEGTDGCRAVITQMLDDGDVRVTEKPQAQWDTMGPYYKISACVAAKEMADVLTIEVLDSNGTVLNGSYATSVRSYAGRALASVTTTDFVRVMMVDMLNYGASAQKHFRYDTSDPANAQLTKEQQAIATAKVTCTNNQVAGANLYGANLSLEDSILLNVLFTGLRGKDLNAVYAVVSFTGYEGTEHEITVPGSAFVKFGSGGDIYKVVVDDIVLADARQPVTVTVYNADGSVHGTGSDSVESYVARAEANNADAYGLYANIMKFAASAYNYIMNR